MRIEKVTIENYKSVKHLEFEPNPGLNAFIGSNSSGKSNIFDAINWLLGPAYPSFNSTKKEDRFLGLDENKIRIRLDFDDGNYLELAEEWMYRDEIKTGLNLNGYPCSSLKREIYCTAYLGVEREILDYLPSNRWSLIGRILQEINRKFLQETHIYNGKERAKTEWLKLWLKHVRDTLLFSVKDENGQEIMSKFLKIVQDESSEQLNRPPSDFKIDLSMYDPWNFYKTLQLIVTEHDMGLEFQASNLGMGVQASISIAILKAYSEINLANNSPIFIDEPELYLHPQAQRNFYRLLRNLASDKKDLEGHLFREGTQVFYTTHSPNFLSTGNFDEIFVVRKSGETGTNVSTAKPDEFVTDLYLRMNIRSNAQEIMEHFKNAYENTGDTQKANEGFFAKKIILVEGQSEALLLPYFFDLIGFDYLKEGISIVRCGNKNEIDRFYRLYNEYCIPCYVIFDGDKSLAGTKDEEENIKKNRAILDLFGQTADYPNFEVSDHYLGFEESFNENLGIKNLKGLELYIEVKKRLKAEELSIPLWVTQVRDKIIELSESRTESVLKKDTEEDNSEEIVF